MPSRPASAALVPATSSARETRTHIATCAGSACGTFRAGWSSASTSVIRISSAVAAASEHGAPAGVDGPGTGAVFTSAGRTLAFAGARNDHGQRHHSAGGRASRRPRIRSRRCLCPSLGPSRGGTRPVYCSSADTARPLLVAPSHTITGPPSVAARRRAPEGVSAGRHPRQFAARVEAAEDRAFWPSGRQSATGCPRTAANGSPSGA